MKTSSARLTQHAAVLILIGILGAFVATAADPAETTPPDRQPGNRPDRANNQGRGGPGGPGRGNFQVQGGGPGSANFQGRGGQAGPGGTAVFGALVLDDKQRELLREASEKDGDELRKLEEKLRAAQKELLHTVLAENYDEKLVREKADTVSKLQTEITMLRAKALATVAPTLKPEQREQIEGARFNILATGGSAFGGGGFGGFGGGGPGGGPGGGGFGNRGGGGPGNNPPGSETLDDGGGRGGGSSRRRPQ